jgi:SAM-dependent methyltransferase
MEAMEVAAAHTEGRRFYEVGCGIGTKLALMYVLGWQVTGLERYEPYLEAARDLVPEARLIRADMRDVERFDADVVFMYRPAIDDATEEIMEKHLTDSVASGTILLVPPETPFFWSLGLERLGPHLWRR